MNMTEPMMITEEMKERTNKRLAEMIERVNKDIKYAVEHNLNSTCFAYDSSDEYYSEVRERFEHCGYKIKPTGYINGVWQRTEDIVW